MPVSMTTKQIQFAMNAAIKVVKSHKSSAVISDIAKNDHELLLSVSIPNSDVSEDGRSYVKALRTLRIIHQPLSMGFYTSFVKVDGVRYNPQLPAFFILLRWPSPSDRVDIVVEPGSCDLESAE